MWGYESPAELLDNDVADIESYINAAYFDCFAPADGTRPWWPEKYHSDMIKAPASANLGVTQGSKQITGFVFEPKYAGSFVQIADRWYRYAGKNATGDDELVQPWDGETGVVGATIFYNAVALPWQVIETAGIPTIIGVGALSPMPDPDAETRLRTQPSVDFTPYMRFWRNRFSTWGDCDTGDPRFYFIDQASVGPEYALGNRFCVYPIPDNKFTFELRASIVPNALTADDDTPQLPAHSVDNILLPIAREKLVENTAGRRYTGPNVQLIIKAADRARAQLKGLQRTQRNTGSCMRVQPGW